MPTAVHASPFRFFAACAQFKSKLTARITHSTGLSRNLHRDPKWVAAYVVMFTSQLMKVPCLARHCSLAQEHQELEVFSKEIESCRLILRYARAYSKIYLGKNVGREQYKVGGRSEGPPFRIEGAPGQSGAQRDLPRRALYFPVSIVPAASAQARRQFCFSRRGWFSAAWRRRARMAVVSSTSWRHLAASQGGWLRSTTAPSDS